MKGTWKAIALAMACLVAPAHAAGATDRKPLATQTYRAERARHDSLRSRAELLSQNPLMWRYMSRAIRLREDDDRMLRAFDLKAKSSESAATAGLKLHNDELEKMVAQVQVIVSR